MTNVDWKGLATGIMITVMITGIFSFLNYLWLSPMIDETLKTADCDKNWKDFIGDTEQAERKTCNDWNHIVTIQNTEMHQFAFFFSSILVPGGFIFMYFLTFRMHLKDESDTNVDSPWRTLPKGFEKPNGKVEKQ